MNEQWKDIRGYQGLYQVSNLGRVRTLNYRQKTGVIRVMSLLKMKEGHLQAVLCKKGCKEQRPLVHRLVFEAFYRRLQPNEVVHHLSGVKNQNISTNLVAWDVDIHKQYHMLGNTHTLGKKIHDDQFIRRFVQRMKKSRLIDEGKEGLEV